MRPVKRASRVLRGARRIRRDSNRRRNILLIKKTQSDRTPNVWNPESQEELEQVMDEYDVVQMEIREREATECLDYKTRLRAKISLSSKEFWKLVRRVIEKFRVLWIWMGFCRRSERSSKKSP